MSHFSVEGMPSMVAVGSSRTSPEGHQLRRFEEFDHRERRLRLDYADAAIAVPVTQTADLSALTLSITLTRARGCQ
jgi:hypothetical protein